MKYEQNKDCDMIQNSETSPLLGKASQEAPKPPGWGYRHLLAFLAFLGFFNVYCMRVNLSVAMVAMVNTTEKAEVNLSSGECPDDHAKNTTTNNNGEFNWHSDTVGYILGSFFYGYLVTQIPGGWMAEKFGGKYMFGYGVLCTAILTLVTPLAARTSVGAFIAVRVLMGIGEGVTFPAMHAMWGKWGPAYERTKLTAFSYAGSQLGTVFAMPLSGFLCDHGFAGGWPSVFYVFGALACLWFIVWIFAAYNTPADHPKISNAERCYIEASVGKKLDLATPWGAILSSPAVWGLCVAHMANNWGFYTMLTSLPNYMKHVLKFDLQTNGILSALPYLACWVGQVSSGFFADFLRSNGYLSTLSTRRLLTSIGLTTPGILLICIQFAGCNHIAVVTMLVLCLGTGGITMGGFQVNHIDLSPNFAGILMGLSNSFGTIPGFLGPQIVGWLTDKNDTRAEWQVVFYISAGVYLSGAVIYTLLARGVVQTWNEPAEGLSFTRDVRHKPVSGPVNMNHSGTSVFEN